MSAKRDITAEARAPWQPTVPVGEFHLLSIGINCYDRAGHFARLHTARFGAEEIARVLQEHYGFAPGHCVTLLDEHATRDAIIQALHERVAALDPNDSLFIYYAGHGCLSPALNIGYWIPVDGVASRPASWVPNSEVKEILKGMAARHVLLVSDSCFAGAFLRAASAPPRITEAYARMAFVRSSRQALTSGAREPVRDDGYQGHSVFTWFLLRELCESQQPYLLPSDIFARIRGGVAENASQQPLLFSLHDAGGEEQGEFVLFRRPKLDPNGSGLGPANGSGSGTGSVWDWQSSLGMRFMAVPGVDGLLSVFPTRVSDYQRYAEAVGAEWPAPEFTQGPGHSAVLVSWDDACCFCSWLTAREVEAGRLGRGQRFRLPTDAEWSQAIGLENEEGPTPERKWLNAQSLGVPESNELKAPEGGQFGYGTYGTVSVEAIPPNRFGLCGLSGNVWEWCADLFAAGNSLRVLRGGSWRTIRPECLRAACRLGRPTEYRADDVGFRVLLESSSRTATPTSTV